MLRSGGASGMMIGGGWLCAAPTYPCHLLGRDLLPRSRLFLL